MTGLTFDADIAAATDLLGKTVSDIQSNIYIDEFGVSGTLKYITGWTAWSGDAEEQSGNQRHQRSKRQEGGLSHVNELSKRELRI